ncbi:hypothetical protein GPECTOR_15g463 [Gonium pectorale]|uniref:Uncharacterized protein n=1 Tax=Gonium pectorale TaxID=33097 RepID=A0A150GLX9_GONPE|nr:hypothetical protein GPECTOR_15g463 [Gonium pectorale]|eukprot:KXZ50778.1 hypothetical protein GPECTOR_15g463 [Gonium pectorale]
MHAMQAEFQQLCAEHRVHEQLQALEPADGVLASTSRASPSPLQLRMMATGERSPAIVATGVDAKGASADVACRAEAAARLHALRQEAAYLQDMVERARSTEARLVEALALRQGNIDKMAATYNRVVSDVKQVYDITRVWPKAPQLGGK